MASWRTTIIKRSCSHLSVGRSAIAAWRDTSPEYTLLPKTHFDGLLTNKDFHVSELQPCNQADVDTSILLHVDNHKLNGARSQYGIVQVYVIKYGARRHCCLGSPSYGWAFIVERVIETFQFTHFTQIFVLTLVQSATPLPSFLDMTRTSPGKSGPAFQIEPSR